MVIPSTRDMCYLRTKLGLVFTVSLGLDEGTGLKSDLQSSQVISQVYLL